MKSELIRLTKSYGIENNWHRVGITPGGRVSISILLYGEEESEFAAELLVELRESVKGNL
jgi:hypothetical protein